MCSVFDVANHAGMERFLKEYGVHHPKRMLYGRRRRPTQEVSIVTARHGEPEVETAIWHLYLERDGDNWKPHRKYWSINSNWQKLGKRPEYRKSRCLIPATAWVESQHGKNPVEFSYGQPFFFCGLYKTWGNLLSCAIITLGAHPKTRQYHDKSLPMIAPADKDFVANWLSGGEDTAPFEPYLHPHIEYAGHPLTVRPVVRATSTEYSGEQQDLS
ncbi:SOS response-associated peptidase family protein [Microbulbifer spongiae]|uniref:SOS response-associated peptidase n=1 Tax=Microbulbifer spongiae TaxID=2944933 RepID=A0ABY9EA68_9GAMM|nr:SOS response-associated peptidase family protein [Microbulbifer sp. MI-G]WKD48319.1 SOS response-associated peptidase [Microbulbifer sp. MI-G]